MNRRRLITGLGMALVLPAQVLFAQDASAGIVAQLKSQGFTQVEVETTWLGRLRILATRADGQREIIVNPRTGEILRDVWTGTNGASKTAILDKVGETSKGGDSGDDGSEDSGSEHD